GSGSAASVWSLLTAAVDRATPEVPSETAAPAPASAAIASERGRAARWPRSRVVQRVTGRARRASKASSTNRMLAVAAGPSRADDELTASPTSPISRPTSSPMFGIVESADQLVVGLIRVKQDLQLVPPPAEQWPQDRRQGGARLA